MKQTEIIPFRKRYAKQNLKYKVKLLCELYIMSIKTKSISALFVALVIILAVNPYLVNNIYNHILGRFALIGIVIFFSMNNLTMGLLLALAIISASNQYSPFVEGMQNGTTIGKDNTTSTGTQQILTRDAVKQITQNMSPEQQDEMSKRISELKARAEAAGVDTEAIKNAIMSKDSKTIPVDPNSKNSEDVSASSEGMLRDTKLEGFRPYRRL